MEKVKYIKVGQAQKRRRVSLRTWLARLNGWTAVWYVFLTAAGVLLYKLGAVYAVRERGYYAVGGEALALLLPVLYYVAEVTARDIARGWKGRARSDKEEAKAAKAASERDGVVPPA